MHLPPIGKRILKSAIAVFFCLLVDQLRQGTGIVFYSCIAAILCMQQDVSSSVRTGRNRVIGTLIGGVFGMLVLAAERKLLLDQWLLQALIVSTVIIAIIYLTVLLHQTTASYISCVVFLSIVISHGHDADPFLFALNRVLDTLIGIALAYAVNAVHIPWRKAGKRLCLCDLAALQETTPAARVQLRRSQERGVRLFLHTLLPIAANARFLQDVHPQGMALFGGSLLYDPKTESYQPQWVLAPAASQAVCKLLKEQGCSSFAYVPCRDVLQIYISEETLDPLSEQLFLRLRRAAAHACIFAPLPKAQAVCAISAILNVDTLHTLQTHMKTIGDVRMYTLPLTAAQVLAVFVPAQATLAKMVEQWKMADERLHVVTAVMAEEALFAYCDVLHISACASAAVKKRAERYGGSLVDKPVQAICSARYPS